MLGSLCAAVVLAGAAWAPALAAAAATPRIDLKVLLLGTSTTEPDVTAWQSALQREGVPFDTLIESSATASGTGYTPVDVSSCPIGTTCQTLSDTASDGTPEAKYEGVVVATAGLGICSTTCTSALSAKDWSALEQYEQEFGIRQVTGDVFPGASYDLNAPTVTGALDGTAGALTADGQTDFSYLQPTAPITMDTGTFGWEATPLATPATGTSFDPLVTGPGGSALVGIYTDANGVQDLVETFDQNQYQLQAELLRHGAIAWVTRGVYFGNQANYLETHVDDNFLSDDSWSVGNATSAPHSTDFNSADALREVPADVATAASWSQANSFRIDMLFNGGGSVAVADGDSLVGAGDGGTGGTVATTSGTATNYDPLLAGFQAADPATGKPYTGDFGWISHTWDHPNIDEGCATQSYIEAELNQNTIWGATAPGATVGDSLTGGLGLTESADPTDALGNENPNVVITGEHSGLANLIPGNPGQVDPPALDSAPASSGGGLASGEYVYAVSDQFNTAPPGATPVAATGESTASESSPVTVAAGGEVTLTWGAVCKAADYNIYRAPFTPGATGATGTTGAWSLIGTVPAVTTTGTSPDTTSDFRDPTSTSDTTGGGAIEKTFVDTGAAGTSATPPSESTANESAYEQTPALDAAFAGTLDGGIKYFGADASKPYPNPADGSFATGATPAGEYPAAATFQDAGATAIPRYPTNIYYNVSTNAQEVDEYETLYDSASTGGTGRCTPVAGVTTCNPAGTTFTIAQIVASVDQGMFGHMMGNDPRPSYFHQTNLMSQTTGTVNGEGDGLFYETLNPLLAEYKQDFASNAPIEQLTMAQIGTLLTEQSAWAANTSVSGYIEGNQVTITNSGTAAATVPLTGITTVGSSYGGTQTGWTSIPAGTSPPVTSSITWPASAALAPTITSSTAAWFTVGSAGDFAVTTTGLPTPALTETGSLPSGATFVDNGNGTATLAGTPAAGTGGSYPITITAVNGIGTSATQSFTVIVDQAPAITSAATDTATAGTALTAFTVTTSGYPAPALSETGSLPSGVTFVDNGTGTATLAGTPAAGTGGSYPITITAANGTSPNATQSFTLTVGAQAPAITSANAATFTAGTAGSFTVTTTGSPTSAITESGPLPGGVTFLDNGDGTATLAGTPTSAGAFPLTITATSAAGTATQSFTLTVGQAPAITSANAATFTVGAAGSFTVGTTGSPTSAITESGPLPGGVTFTDNGTGTGTATLAGTPAAGTAGSYPITITATNATGMATQSFMLTVDQAPAITSAATATVTVGKALSFSVTTTGSPTSAITESGALPSGVTFTDNGTGTGTGTGTATLAGTPAAGTAGSYPITITATNPAGTATQSFMLTVDQAPAFTSAATATATVSSPSSFTVTTTGYPAATITKSGALPRGTTFTDANGTATIAGTPTVAGTYTLSLTAANGTSPNPTQSLVLTVLAAGGPTITSTATDTGTVGTALTPSFTVTTSGAPAPSLTKTGALPAGVTFTNNGNGTATISGTPTAGGVFTLTITAKNTLGSAIQTFTLTVNQVPALTSAATTTAKVGTAFSFTMKTSGYPVPAITESGTLPGGVAFADQGNGTATISGTPTAGGVFTLKITAKNSAGTSIAQTFTMTVRQAPKITSAATATATVGTAFGFTVATSGTPAPSLTKTGTLPGGVTFTNNTATGAGTATISGTPTAEGVFTLKITAKNSAGTSTAQTFTLTVSQAPKITSAATATATVGTALSFTVKTSGYPAPAITESGALPGGVTFTNGNGTASIAGTPTASGTFTLALTAKNSLGTATQTLTIRVRA